MFRIGQRALCTFPGPYWVDDDEVSVVPGPVRGEVVTVAANDGHHLWLEEYRGPRCFYTIENLAGEVFFRPLSDTRLAIFRSLLQPIPSPEKERA